LEEAFQFAAEKTLQRLVSFFEDAYTVSSTVVCVTLVDTSIFPVHCNASCSEA